MTFLPPTTNALDQEQRNRLIKSTRKLEAVLGTTPRILEPVERPSFDSVRSASPALLLAPEDLPPRSSSRASHRSARIYSSSRSSVVSFSMDSDSDDSFPSDTEASSPELSPIDLPRPSLTLGADLPPTSRKGQEPSLFLRLQAVPHPSSAASASSLSLNKFSSSSALSADLRTAVPRQYISRPSSPLSPISPTMDNLPNMQDVRRRKMAKLARTLGENIPPELVASQVAGNGKSRARRNSLDDRRLSASRTAAAPSSSRARDISQIYHAIDVEVPRSIRKYYCDEATPTNRRGGGVQRGPSSRVEGKHWDGEWNQDMEDVMSKLRGLKGR